LQAGQFLLYTSTKDGERLQLTVGSFSSDDGNNDENEPVLLIINKDQKYQAIHGFGGAMTDAVALNLRTLSNGTQQQVLKYVINIHQLGT